MFTGIIKDVGHIVDVDVNVAGDRTFRIETQLDLTPVPLGASVACNGVCLTVIEKGDGWFKVDISNETLGVTTLRYLGLGSTLNIEPSLKLGDEMGGHLVMGHVDCIGKVVTRNIDGQSVRYEIEIPADFTRYIAPKGSVAVNGVSLTVNHVAGQRFGINIIPHTASETTFADLETGDRVNIEIDTMARYVARLVDDKMDIRLWQRQAQVS